jgi:hypothetical protein
MRDRAVTYLLESPIIKAAKAMAQAITITSHAGLGLWNPGMKKGYLRK